MAIPVRTDIKDISEARQSISQIVQYLSELEASYAGKGAARVGVADAGSVWTGTNVEAVLDEINARLVAGGH